MPIYQPGGGGGSGYGSEGHASGRWYPLGHAVSTNTQDTAGNRGLFAPFWSRGWSIDGLAINVVTAGSAGALIRLGIYASGADGQPSDLVVDGGTVDATASGVKTLTIAETLIPDGLSWAVVAVQGAPATKPVYHGYTDSRPEPGDPSGTPPGLNFMRGLRTGSGVVTGSFPATAPSSLLSATEAPLLMARTA